MNMLNLPLGIKLLRPEDLFIKGKPRVYIHSGGSLYGRYFYYDGESSCLTSDTGEKVNISSPVAMQLYPLNCNEVKDNILELRNKAGWLEKYLSLVDKRRKPKNR